MQKRNRFSQSIIGIILLIIVFSKTASAQWTRTNSPDNVGFLSFGASGSKFFAGAQEGLFFSTDNGASWDSVNAGLTGSTVHSFVTHNSYLYVATIGGVFRSDDNGATWRAVNSGISSSNIYALAASGNYVFAATKNYIYRSDNNGLTWWEVNSGLTTREASALLVSGNDIFAGTVSGIFRTSNNGDSWTEVYSDKGVSSLAKVGSTIFAGTNYGVIKSTDNGTTWTPVNFSVSDLDVYAFAVNGLNLYVGSRDEGVLHLPNNSNNLSPINTGLDDLNVLALTINGNYLYAGTAGSGIWRRPLTEITTSIENKLDSKNQSAYSQVYPNPFHEVTNIQFKVPNKSFVNLRVLNSLGQEITNLVSENLDAGTYNKQWNAINLTPGIYFYQIQIGKSVETKKIVVN